MSPKSGTRVAGETCRVLVVEDDFDSAEFLCLMIEDAGHECRVALNAAEARTIVEDFAPEVALIDIGLPGETGYDLLQSLKRDFDGCRFVAVTGYVGSELSKQSFEVGFEAHLTKPVSMELLRAVLDHCASDLKAASS
ncbi:MAG TPA: response regulator [Polyangiaceae bacterium]|jgi:CheY-like chemotaxis protein|nr:response regulator [Polyangiaceae bacterium]